MPVPGINRAVVQAVNVGLSIDPNVQAVLISDEPEEAAADPEALGEAAARGPAGHRRVAVPGARRAAPLVPRRPRPGVAVGQGRADHVRRHPRVRRPELVGADPLQPVGEAAPRGAPRAGRTRSWSTCRTGARSPSESPEQPASPPTSRRRRPHAAAPSAARRDRDVPDGARGRVAVAHPPRRRGAVASPGS